MTPRTDKQLARRVAVYHTICDLADRMETDVRLHDDKARGEEFAFLADTTRIAALFEEDSMEDAIRGAVAYGVAWLEALEEGRSL